MSCHRKSSLNYFCVKKSLQPIGSLHLRCLFIDQRTHPYKSQRADRRSSFSFTERDRERPLCVWKTNQAIEERSTEVRRPHQPPGGVLSSGEATKWVIIVSIELKKILWGYFVVYTVHLLLIRVTIKGGYFLHVSSQKQSFSSKPTRKKNNNNSTCIITFISTIGKFYILWKLKLCKLYYLSHSY